MIRMSLILVVFLVGASGGCATEPTHLDPTRILVGLRQQQLNEVRIQLARGEWSAARARLNDLIRHSSATEPDGAQARLWLARVLFELGDFSQSIETAHSIESSTLVQQEALEIEALSQLFRCDFDEAIATLFKLVALNPSRGHVWLGVAYAWTGADDNAQRELQWVVEHDPASEHTPNAWFYLMQLALWRGQRDTALHAQQELVRRWPEYLTQLAARAQNWSERHVHGMRAYFTFDTLARLHGLDLPEDPSPYDARLEQALRTLSQESGRCSAHVPRLARAWNVVLQSRVAHRDNRIRLETLAEQERRQRELEVQDDDNDGLVNVRDACPEAAEIRNGIDDDDGCPEDTAAVELVGGQIRLRAGYAFHFATGASEPLPLSVPVLDQVAAVLQRYSWIHRVRIEGHTDDIGDGDDNLVLSRDRVRAVGLALQHRGIDPTRLEFSWFGEARPLVNPDSEQARSLNRRVEILVVDPPTLGASGGW